MALREELEKQGQWLFRWRSYLPLIIIPFFLFALAHSEIIERTFGDTADTLWEIVCIMISFTGLLIRCLTIGFVSRGTSGRNTKEQRADELNTSGMYSMVRNPLYLANFFIMLGILLFVQVWWFILLVLVFFWFFYERIIFTEEEFLRKKFGEQFLEWTARTPIFWPRFKNWHKPALPFSWKTVLRREHSTLFAVVSSFCVLDIASDVLSEGIFEIKPRWLIFFIVSLLLYLTLRMLKKRTHVLDVSGR